MIDEEEAEKYVENILCKNFDNDGTSLYTEDEIKKAVLYGLAEGRKEVREHETTCVNRLHHVEKENAKLKAQIELYKEMLERNPCVVTPDWHCSDCLKENEELKATVELNSSIANSFQHKICILEKENAELHKLIKDYENDSVEALCKVNDLKIQIEKMKCCGNCRHYSFHLNVCHAHERKVWKTFEDTISCGKWELAK